MAIEIVDLPSYKVLNRDFPVRYVNVYREGINGGMIHMFDQLP